MARIDAMTRENFEQEVLQAKLPVLVDFWAPWCGYCRRIAPALEALAGELEGKVRVVGVHADEQPELLARYQVEYLPTLMLFQNGNAVGAMVAPGSKAAVEDFLREKLEG